MIYRTLLLCFATGMVVVAWAQPVPPVARGPRIDFSKVEIRTTRLSDNFFTLEGQGGRISVLTGPDGVLMVDSQFAPLTDKIVAAIKQISDQPIRFLVNTHLHGDHTGGNENLGKLGVLIFSRDQLRCRLIHRSPGPNGEAPPSAPAKALPVVTYDGPVTLHINGEEVQLIPIRAAHTDGDTLIRLPKHDALVVGDYYRSAGYPFVDIISGGTLEGLLAGLGETIGLAGPNTKIIPGHGPIVDENAVTAHRNMMIALRDRVAPLVKQGKTQDEVVAAKVNADYDSKVPEPGTTGERFITQLYAELKAGAGSQ